MFVYSKFNQDISNWDVDNVLDVSWMFANSEFNKDILNWSIKLNEKCDLRHFIKNIDIEINSYEDFKQYRRKIILKKLYNKNFKF